jgi:hypothetical protein
VRRFAMRAFVLVFVYLACLAVYRADELAAVTGLVTDPHGRSVPGVTVLITNLNTNVASRTVTNDQGIYRVPSLQPGIYRITIDKDGFKSIVKSGIELHVQDVASINFELQIGSVNETVTVEAGAPLINTESATVSTVVDRHFAENLPLNGRSFQSLIQLAPGVVVVPSNASDSGQFSVNGQRAVSNYWTVDGVSANIGLGVNQSGYQGNGLAGGLGSFSALGGTNSLVSVDALQEFRIQTSTYAPEFGRATGGQISIVTRSGTNQFHGTAFDYVRNDVFDASDWFNGYTNSPPLPKAEERQNDFGGTFSGPILKDRTFFFFSYEGLRLRLPQTVITDVPDLSSRQSAVAAVQPFLNAFPLPNGADNPATGIALFNASFSNPATLDAYSLRVDHRLSKKWNLFGRYNYSPSSLAERAADFSASTVYATSITTQTGTLGATWLISAEATNDLRFNYSQANAVSNYHLDSFGGAVPFAPPFPSPITTRDGFFAIRIFSLQNGALTVGNLGQNEQRQINIVDSLSVQKGSHGLKFGVDFRRLSPRFNPNAYLQDALFFSLPPLESGTGNFSILQSSVGATFLFRNLGVYAQDTWRILPRVTLTYGLRWDVDFSPSSISGPNFPAVTGFNLGDLSQLSVAPAGTPPFHTAYGNVAPRLGIAYLFHQSPDWQTVFRGGLGLFYDLATTEFGTVINSAFPFVGSSLLFGQPFPLSAEAAAPPPITLASLQTGASPLSSADPHLNLPYTIEWNVALEQALGKQQTISASYVGAAGRRLIQTTQVFLPNPNIFEALLITNAATSDYNALQIQFQRRLSHGLQALASYTWSHSIDDGSAGSVFGNVSNALGPASVAKANRGPSDFDIRNAFSTGVTYDVPAPKVNAFTNAILRGWSLENIVQARSAPPVDVNGTVINGMFVGSTIDNFTFFPRPDVVPGQPLYLFGPQFPGRKAFNPAAFTAPPIDPSTGMVLRNGDLGRNALRGFGAAQWDFAVHRDFPIRESLRLQFRAEMFNVLNHPNFGQPDGLLSDPQFGKSTQSLAQSLNNGNLGGGAFNPLYQIGGPRSIQLALKLIF